MTGKSKSSSFKYLLLTSLIVIVVNTIYFQKIFISICYFLSLSLSFLFVKYGINVIQGKNLLQNIRAEGPVTHLKKRNTPTMGGIIIIPIFLLIALLTDFQGLELKIIFLITIFGFFIIGLYDDFLGIKNKINKGLSVKQ